MRTTSASSDPAARSRLAVRVVPGAARDGLSWDAARGWIVRVAAPPVDGKANERLCAYLARAVFHVAPSRVVVRTGAGGRQKVVEVDLDAAAFAAALDPWRAA